MKTVISVKVDDSVKKQAQDVASHAGISLSALINSYLTQVIATRRIELYAPEPMTKKLEKLIAEVEKERHAGKTAGPFDSAGEMIRALHKKPR